MTLAGVYFFFYSLALLLCFVCFAIISSSRPNSFQQRLVIMLALTAVMILGYCFKIRVNTREEWFLAEKLVLISGSFIYYYVLMLFAQFCKLRVPKWVSYALNGVSVILVGMIFSANHTDIIFKDFTFENSTNLSYKAGGILIAYRLMACAYCIALFSFVFIFDLKRGHKRSKKIHHQAQLLSIVPLAPAISFLLDILLKTPSSLVPIGLMVGIGVMMFLIYGYKLLDINDDAREEALENLDIAIVTFFEDGAFKGCNPHALLMFPELGILAMREKPEGIKYKKILELLSGEVKEITFEKKIYERDLREIRGKNGQISKVLTLTDKTAHKEVIDMMSNYQMELEKIVDEKVKDIINIQAKIMTSLADVIENRDGNTGGHVKRTSAVVSLLMDRLLKDGYENVDSHYASIVSQTAPLHDVGKLVIEDRILRKPARLDDEEYARMKDHSKRGAEIIEDVLQGVENEEVLKITENIAHYHHERWDGLGYPEGLKGKAIPLEARVMAIADVYDALVSKRCYKEAFSFEKAYEIMAEGFGKQFDPSLKKYFDASLESIESFYRVNGEN